MVMTMPGVSTDLFRWLLLAALLCCSSCQSMSSSFENKTGQNDTRPRIFSPRMDYDEWTPLGRGDPLKNNPTFDYVPPVLDRVQYWLDSHTTEPSAKRDILVLGVTAKKTSPKIPEQFLKFVDGPKFTRNNQESSYRNDFTGSTGAEPPKVLRTTNFRNRISDYRSQSRIRSTPPSFYPSPYYSQKSKPYTMMLPPPMVQKPSAEPSTSFNGANNDNGYPEASQQFSTQTEEGPIIQDSQFYSVPSKAYNQHHLTGPSKPQAPSKSSSKGVVLSQVETIKSVYTPPSSQSLKNRYEATTTPSVSFEKSNLIYQSTQTLAGGWLGNNGPTSASSIPEANQVTWQTPDYSRDHYDIDHHVSASSNHEVIVGQNANIIVDGDSNENEEVVIGQKEILPSEASTSVSPLQTSTSSGPAEEEENDKDVKDEKEEEKMHIIVANSPSSILELESHTAKKGPVALVMPTNYVEKKNTTTPQRAESTLVLQQNNVSGSPMTVDTMEKTVPVNEPMGKPQPVKSTMMSPPMSVFMEDSSVPVSSGNWMNQMHHQQPPPRHPANPPHMFGPPIPQMSAQLPPQQMTRPQSRPNHSMMHFMGPGPRPGGFRPPAAMSMSHLPSPMTHMHAPPMKGVMMPPMVMEQTHQRPPQLQPFQMTFTTPPQPSTLILQTTGTEDQSSFDRQPSRMPEMQSFSTTPSAVTADTTGEIHTTVNAEVQDRLKFNQSPLLKILKDEQPSKDTSTVSPSTMTTLAPQTTTVPNLTTDPIFSHYKQPAKPIRGPMYLIIQGHSKVKTYKPTVSKHGMPMENNEILENATERQLSKLEQLIKDNTKNGIASVREKVLEEKKEKKMEKKNSQDSLMSLVDSGFSGFTVSPSTGVTDDERQENSVTTVEMNGN